MGSLNTVLRFGIREGNDRQELELFVGQADEEQGLDFNELLEGVTDDDGELVPRDELNEEAVNVLRGLVDEFNERGEQMAHASVLGFDAGTLEALNVWGEQGLTVLLACTRDSWSEAAASAGCHHLDDVPECAREAYYDAFEKGALRVVAKARKAEEKARI